MYARDGLRRTRRRLQGVLIALVGILPACAVAPAADAPLVDLDASALRPGPLASWPNGGALAGSFEVRSSDGPVVGPVAGRAAVKLSEKMWLRSTFPAPASIVRGRPFTLAVWAHPAKLFGNHDGGADLPVRQRLIQRIGAKRGPAARKRIAGREAFR